MHDERMGATKKKGAGADTGDRRLPRTGETLRAPAPLLGAPNRWCLLLLATSMSACSSNPPRGQTEGPVRTSGAQQVEVTR
ncbi:MAG: hypothetical protein ACRENP_25915, partial [Longimicrobiales bacterium]